MHPRDGYCLGFCWSGYYNKWKVLPFGLYYIAFAKTVYTVNLFIQENIMDAKEQLLYSLEGYFFNEL